jgi:bacterioferritin
VLTTDEWTKITNCGYEKPDDPFVSVILDQNIKGEQCAIRVYSELLDLTRVGDPITYDVILQILKDEVEHEEDLVALKEDFDLMIERRK